MITSFDQLDTNKTYTYADYLTWQLDEMVELIRGKIVRMSPAPSRRHQSISRQIFGHFFIYFQGKACELYEAPFDVRLTLTKEHEKIETVVQPDICVICDSSKLDDRGCLGAPDLIVEILSKRTMKKDLNDKFNLYQENGVVEYWVVDPSSEFVQIFALMDGKYQSIGIFDKENPSIDSLLFSELNLTIQDVFC